MWFWFLVAYLTVLPTTAVATTPLFASSFDCVDNDNSDTTGTTSYDCYEFVANQNSAAEDDDIEIYWSGFNDSSQSAHDSSHAAAHINISVNNEQAYYEPAGTDYGMCSTGHEDPCWDDSDCTSSECRIADNSPFPLNEQYLTWRQNLHLGATAPGADRRILEFREISTCNGGTNDGLTCYVATDCPSGTCTTNLGCNVELDENRKFQLYYNTEQEQLPSFVVREWACASPYTYLPCANDSDCPGGTNGACTADNSPAQVPYWAPIELTQNSASPSVTCELRIAGRKVASIGPYDPTTQTPANISYVRFGATDTATGTIEYWVDDVALFQGGRAGFGYVATIYPTSDGSPTLWNTTGSALGCKGDFCDGGDTAGEACTVDTDCDSGYPPGTCDTISHWQCVDDFNRSCAGGSNIYEACNEDSDCPSSTCNKNPVLGDKSNQSILISKRNRVEMFDDMTSDIGLAAPNLATAIDVVAFGQNATTGGAGNREFKLGIRILDDRDIVTTVIPRVGDLANNDKLYGRVAGANPSLGRTNFTQSDIDSLDIFVETTDNNTSSPKVGAIHAYVVVTRPDTRLPDVISWGNKGTDDSLDTIVFVGDSTSIGTAQVVCSAESSNAGQSCSQETVCSWDGDRDKGNCAVDNDCQTCTLRHEETRGQLGYLCDVDDANPSNWDMCGSICDGGDNDLEPCTVDSDCPNGGTCILHTCDAGGECGAAKCCSRNPAVSCVDASDCNVDLGTCQSTATCDYSCPGGSCPVVIPWPTIAAAGISHDVAVNCGEGGMTSYILNDSFSGIDNMLDGDDARTNTIPRAWCSAITNTGQCECSSDADCEDTGGGSCSVGGLCTTSDIGRDVCTITFDCASGKACRYDKPDAVVVLIGVNDIAHWPPSPNCVGRNSLGVIGSNPLQPCSPSSITECTTDSDCVSAVHADSICLGTYVKDSSKQTMCASGRLSHTGATSALCTVWRNGCNTDADCANGTCSVNQPASQRYEGTCTCTDDAHCPNDYKCLNNICRKKCFTCEGGANAGLRCDTGSDCPGSTCSASSTYCAGGVAASRTCDTTGGANACKGACTKPSRATWCDDDSDCTSTAWQLTSSVTVTGTCDVPNNECTCTGWNHCPHDSSCFTQHQQQWLVDRSVSNRLLNYMDEWQQDVDNLNESDSAPKLFLMTVPDYNSPECGRARPDKQYLRKTRQLLVNARSCVGGAKAGLDCVNHSDCTGSGLCLRRYPYVIDVASEMDKYAKTDVLRDPVHFSTLGETVVGDFVASFFNAFNTCAVRAGTTTQAPQMYCRNADDTWDSGGQTCTLATESTDCSASQTCQIRLCIGTANTGEGDCPSVGDTCYDWFDLPVHDDFERASLNENQPSNWAQATGDTDNCQIDSSSDLEVSGTNDSMCYWTANLVNTDSYACAQFSRSTSSNAGVCLGMTSTGTGVCCSAIGTGGGWELDNMINEVWNSNADSGTTNFAIDDYIGIVRTAGSPNPSFRCYRATAAAPTTWTALGASATSVATGDNPGYAGALMQNTTNRAIEVWEAGNGTLPTTRACGAN